MSLLMHHCANRLGPLAIPQKKKVQKKARQAKEAAVEVVRPEQVSGQTTATSPLSDKVIYTDYSRRH